MNLAKQSRSVLLILSSISLLACASVESRSLTYDDNKVNVEVYKSTKKTEKKKNATIIITPPTGGSTPLEHSYSIRLAQKGFKVVRMLKWEGQGEKSLDLSIHKKLLEKAQLAIKTVMKNNPSEKYGILGTSVGGMHATLALARNPEIKTGVIIAAGAPFSEVIAFSNQSALKEYREKRIKKYNFTSIEKYEEALRQTNIPKIEDYKADFRNKNILFVLATEDQTVPTKQQKKLLKALHPKEKFEIESGHLWSILKNWLFNKDEITNFIDTNLD